MCVFFHFGTGFFLGLVVADLGLDVDFVIVLDFVFATFFGAAFGFRAGLVENPPDRGGPYGLPLISGNVVGLDILANI